jgi:pyruvate/2-oxoglutarate dehydrogenase complex dihydrolipoamide dehydrogenase (E3) component
MAVDYDLVILGGTVEGRQAALTAAQVNARVALIEPNSNEQSAVEAEQYRSALIELGQAAQHRQHSEPAGMMGLEIWDDRPFKLNWPLVHQGIQATAAHREARRSLERLLANGVDVVLGDPVIETQPQLHVRVGDRSIRARAYLLATGSQPAIPAIPGLADVNYLTPDTLATLGDRWPQRWTVLGADLQGLELAQAFAGLGSSVTLLVRGKRILPQEDAEVAYYLQAALEAQGIRVITEAQPRQIEQVDAEVKIQLLDQTLKTDALLVAAGRQPRWATLPLKQLGIQAMAQGLSVNQQLRTTHPQFYACGALIGGYGLSSLACYEADLAVHNALFLPRRSVQYWGLPWAIATQPEFATVGLTTEQAQARYGEAAWTLRTPFKTLPKAHSTGHLTGLCKLMVHSDGLILGAHIIGPAASEMVSAIALAMRQKLSIGAIAQLPQTDNAWSTILAETAQQWQHRKQQNSLSRELRESWFSFRRSRLR